MSLTVQNLRAVGPGVEPASLLPGQICFNVTDKVLFTGDGSDFKSSFDGTVVPGVPGAGWFSTPLDFSQFSDNFIVNPEVYGDIPTDGQVLTWDSTLGHTVWTNGGSTSNIVYATTNANVAAAPGATLTAKINTAIGVASPDPNDWVVVTGLPGDVFQGLYYFDTAWEKAANYAFPTGAQVPYSNTVSGLTANDVQEAIDELDTLTAAAQGTADAAFAAAGIAQDAADAAQATADQAVADAAAAQAVADAALPRSGGTMTGTLNTLTLNTQQVNVGSGYGVTFASGANGTIFGISGVVNSTSTTTAASSAAVKTVNDVAIAALARSGGTMTGVITFASGQTFPISGIDIASGTQLGVIQVGSNLSVTAGGLLSVNVATTSAPGVVQVGNHLNVSGAGLLDVRDASTTQAGAVQLNNTLTSTSVFQALTAAQGKALADQISSLTIAGSTTLAGSINASNGLLQTVTTQGQAAGFVVGQALPAPAPNPSPPGNNNYYVLVTTPGTFIPTGSTTPVTSDNGDWILSNGTAWQELEVGARPSYASTGTAGIVQLATCANTVDGTDGTLAVTPLGLQAKVSNSISTTCSNLIASSTAVKTAYDVGNAALPRTGGTMTGNITFQDTGEGIIFGAGSQLFAISNSTSVTSSTTAASSTAVKTAFDIASAAIPCSVISNQGDILAANSSGVPTALPIGLDGQVLVVNTACTTGLEWVSDTPGDVTSVTGSAPIVVDNSDPQNPIVGIDAATLVSCGAVQLSDALNNSSDSVAATAGALCTTYNLADLANTTANAAIPCAAFLAKGNLLGGIGTGAYSALTVGTNGQVLIADSACTTGLKWGNACYVPDACFTAAGQIIVGTGAGTYVALPVGTNCQTLVVNSACTATGGVTWGVSLSGYTCSASPFSTALGVEALDSVTSGLRNVAVGYCAGTAVTSGSDNVLMGAFAGDSLTGGSSNVAIGSGAFISGTGNNNSLVGFNSGCALTTATSNVLVGASAGSSVTTGSSNTIIGSVAGSAALTGNAILAAGSTIKFQANNAGAWSYDGTNFGTAGQFLASQGSAATPVWCTLSLACVPCSAFTAVGDILVGTGAATFSPLALGTSGQALVVDTACPSGVKWVTASGLNLAGYTCLATPFNTAFGACAGDSITTGTCNTLVGFNAGTALTSGVNNVAIGPGALDATSAGGNNVAIGPNALGSSTTGVNNLAIGFDALAYGNAGTGNLALGISAGANVSSGINNVFIAQGSGDAITTGACNIVIGFNAMGAATTTTEAIAIGVNAGCVGITGAQSVLVGTAAGQSSTGVGATHIGYAAGCSNASAGCTTYLGFVAGRNATGLNNTYVGALTGCAASNASACGTLLGFCAGSALTTGNGNTLLGMQAGRFVTSGAFNVAIGAASLQTASTGSNNIAIGCGSLAALSTSSGNVAVGHRAMLNATTAGNNVAIGCEAGTLLSTSNFNTLVGSLAGDAITSGDCNSAFGYCALSAAATSNNVAIGAFAGAALTLSNNTLVGFCAGATLSNSPANTFVGCGAGRLATTGQANTGIGCGALGAAATTGSNNLALGVSAGEALTTGSGNTFVGYLSGRTVTTGGQNTLVGSYAGTATLANNVVLSDGAGTIRFQANSSGAWSPDGINFGNAGQVLQSAGTGAAPTWTTPIWQPLTTLTTTSTTATTLLSVPVASTRAVFIDISVSDVTGGNYHTDSYQVVTDGTSTDDQQIPGARLGTNPYSLTSAVVGANLVISVTSASANSTKYVGSYQTIAV